MEAGLKGEAFAETSSGEVMSCQRFRNSHWSNHVARLVNVSLRCPSLNNIQDLIAPPVCRGRTQSLSDQAAKPV